MIYPEIKESWHSIDHGICDSQLLKQHLPFGERLTVHNHHFFYGKAHELSTGPFSIAMLHYQRVEWCIKSDREFV